VRPLSNSFRRQAHDGSNPTLSSRRLEARQELTYLRASTEAYYLFGIKGWKFDHDAFRLTPVLPRRERRPIFELREMYEQFKNVERKA